MENPTSDGVLPYKSVVLQQWDFLASISSVDDD